ncbi:IclR family transcriptional regulator [Natronolimnobius sp. AArcel1]|uniref:IclR family transcriptional regulator n=1 Tax=Natronolimnobius sp. AArcel1 TaxID=1679093 RepID=UPI0013EC4089|nr:IclR family transcriptional regulator [Natronolimnobius sp. AArcel1]NGM71123.1 IclR family transcriptional regulator [Natronolimnobius sp. AArcel1]
MPESDYPVGSVATTVRIIEALNEFGEAGITDLSEQTGVSNSSVHKHLDTLQSLGYVRKDGTSYSLSLRFLGIGNEVRSQREVVQAAKPAVDSLSSTAGAVTNLMLVEHGYGVYAYRATGGASNMNSYLPVVGDRVHLHATAGGKAILSQMEWDEITEIIETNGLPKLTDKTIDSRDALRRELRSIQDRGLAFERGEHLPSVQCVAAPITTTDGPVGSISVSGSIDQMSGKKLEEDLAGLVVSTTNEIELELFRD